MPISTRHAVPSDDEDAIVGTARLTGPDTGFAALKPGDIAVIDVEGLQRTDAERLVDAGVVAVLNVSPSASEQFPSLGPRVLTEAGVWHVDSLGAGLKSSLRSGEVVTVRDGEVLRAGEVVARGTVQTAAEVEAGLSRASSALSTRLDSVAANAADRLRREREMLFEGARVPTTTTRMRGRAAVVVIDAYQVRSDLGDIKRFIHDHDPVIIAVGSAIDIVDAAGLRCDIAVGRSSELTDTAINRSREIVFVSPDGRVDNADRFERKGTELHTFAASGASADLAVILADSNDADVIVVAGAPPTLADLLERDTSDISSAFVARLRAGTKVVDAKAVRYFLVQRVGWTTPLLLVLAGVVALLVAIATTPLGQTWYADPAGAASQLWAWIEGLFS